MANAFRPYNLRDAFNNMKRVLICAVTHKIEKQGRKRTCATCRVFWFIK